MCSHRRFRCTHIVTIAVVGSDQKLKTVLVAERYDISDNGV